MKIIKIDNCGMCPHFRVKLSTQYGSSYYCDRGKELDMQPVTIPDWCPLEDY